MRLSNQAMGAIMMALQKSLLEQTDITPILEGFIFEGNENKELSVKNPPNFKIDNDIFDSQIKESVNAVGSD